MTAGDTDLVEVLAEQCAGLRGRQVAELGHEVHLPLGQHAGRGPQLPLPLADGLVLVLDGCVQSLDRLVQLEQRALLLGAGEGQRSAPHFIQQTAFFMNTRSVKPFETQNEWTSTSPASPVLLEEELMEHPDLHLHIY